MAIFGDSANPESKVDAAMLPWNDHHFEKTSAHRDHEDHDPCRAARSSVAWISVLERYRVEGHELPRNASFDNLSISGAAILDNETLQCDQFFRVGKAV